MTLRGVRRHLPLVLAVLLWLGAAGRDRFDGWVDATVLPSLAAETSVEVLDRNGVLLRAYTVSGGRWRLTQELAGTDPLFLRMLLAYEDKRFRDHAGVDPRAVARAVWQALATGRLVSGGSTMTMQVARLLEDGPTGKWSGKLRQARLALALERHLTKDEILSLYLDRAPYGGNIEGIRAATRAYYGKDPRRLTPAASAPRACASIVSRSTAAARTSLAENRPASPHSTAASAPRACASIVSRSTAATCTSLAESGLVLRQTRPMVRVGRGSGRRATATRAERVSSGTAICGISVTPMPAPTICTSVAKELPSIRSRGSEGDSRQKDSA